MKIAIATNNGDIGGGEVMLLALAREAAALGHHVLIVTPDKPDSLSKAAQAQGFEVQKLQASTRQKYMLCLRKWWSRRPADLLWCNGMLPALATSGMARRVVHLHQMPSGKLKPLVPFAIWNSLRVLVPSTQMSKTTRKSVEFWNWSEEMPKILGVPGSNSTRIGFIGRFSSGKGLPILIEAANLVSQTVDGNLELVLAGEPRFAVEADQKRVRESITRSKVPTDQVGWIAPSDFFSMVDLVVVPSVQPESFGLVAAEAMSAKKPLIVTDAGALPEIVGEGYPWIARAGDSGALSAVLIEALGTSSSETKRIVEKSYRRWKSLYSPEAGRQRLANLLYSIERA